MGARLPWRLAPHLGEAHQCFGPEDVGNRSLEWHDLVVLEWSARGYATLVSGRAGGKFDIGRHGP